MYKLSPLYVYGKLHFEKVKKHFDNTESKENITLNEILDFINYGKKYGFYDEV